MGNLVGNQILFPAPDSTYDDKLRGLIWDTQFTTEVTRPFLYIPYHSLNATKAPTILYLHANACDLGGMSPELHELSRVAECNVLAVEYPGYGLLASEATSPEGINQSAEHGVELLLGQGVHPSEIILFGRSIGTGPATRVAKLFKARGWTPYGLILQSPYISIHRVVSEYWRLGSWMIDNHWDNKKGFEKLGLDFPLLIVHGEKDEIIPVNHGKELFTSCQSRRKHLVCPAAATHNEWDIYSDVFKPVRDFVKRYRPSAIDIPVYQSVRRAPSPNMTSPIMRGI